VEEDQRAEVAAGRAALLHTLQWYGGQADVWSVFRNAEAFQRVVAGMVAPFRTASITAVAGLESGGFLLGGAAAIQLGVGFIAIRKAGSLFPGDTERLTTARDYRGRNHELLLQRDRIDAGDRVLLVDDWAETGSQARTAEQLIRQCGAVLVGTSVMIDQLDAHTRAELTNVASLARFADLQAADYTAALPSRCVDS
jgi:adenine phosphoribosyltransferase